MTQLELCQIVFEAATQLDQAGISFTARELLETAEGLLDSIEELDSVGLAEFYELHV